MPCIGFQRLGTMSLEMSWNLRSDLLCCDDILSLRPTQRVDFVKEPCHVPSSTHSTHPRQEHLDFLLSLNLYARIRRDYSICTAECLILVRGVCNITNASQTASKAVARSIHATRQAVRRTTLAVILTLT